MKSLVKEVELQYISLAQPPPKLVRRPALCAVYAVSDVTVSGTGQEVYDRAPDDLVAAKPWPVLDEPGGDVDDLASYYQRESSRRAREYHESNSKVYRYLLASRWDARDALVAVLNMTHGPWSKTPVKTHEDAQGQAWWVVEMRSTMAQAAAWGESGLEQLSKVTGLGSDADGDATFMWAQWIASDLLDFDELQRKSTRPDEQAGPFAAGTLYQCGSALNKDLRGTEATDLEVTQNWGLVRL